MDIHLTSEESILQVNEEDFVWSPNFAEIISKEAASSLRLLWLALSLYPGVVLGRDQRERGQYFEE
jgi:hypothetical protein